MSTCKDCLHYEVCQALEDNGDLPKINPKRCGCFKDRSKFIELPCKVGDTVYQMVYCYDRKNRPVTIRPNSYIAKEVVGIHICDSRLRVNALSNKKYRDYLIVGACNSLEHIPFSKIGKSVFLTKEEAEQALTERG